MERRDPREPAASDPRAALQALSKDELIELVLDDAKNWLAHDGLWFQAVERAHGMDAAIAADGEAWARFTVIEAQRIMARLRIAPGGGIPALLRCLEHRLYARLNRQEATEVTDRRAVFVMRDCRVQSARRRKGLPDFPCKPVGLVEYAGFARTIDPRLVTRCITCPPDAPREDLHCAWEFTLEEGVAAGATERAP
jgi:Family of unknown function (DUF6125)